MEELLVGIDVGCRQHRVAIGTPDGVLIDQFDLDHQPVSLDAFFVRDEKQAAKFNLPRTMPRRMVSGRTPSSAVYLAG